MASSQTWLGFPCETKWEGRSGVRTIQPEEGAREHVVVGGEKGLLPFAADSELRSNAGGAERSGISR